jgi:hypothetical protein
MPFPAQVASFRLNEREIGEQLIQDCDILSMLVWNDETLSESHMAACICGCASFHSYRAEIWWLLCD